MAFDKEQFKEFFFKLGVAFIILGVLVFLGLTPRGRGMNPVGGARIGTVVLICVGLAFLALDRYLNR
ncbi:MAG TPA: hypothetical protein VF544_11950 [Pyrinomonadaceae bacterium]|jgi:hypothetical protein